MCKNKKSRHSRTHRPFRLLMAPVISISLFTFAVIINLSIVFKLVSAAEDSICDCGGKSCVLLPPTNRDLPCYQGSPDDAVQCFNTDPFLASATSWKCSTCEDEGFTHFMRNDPIYKNMQLWSKAGHKTSSESTSSSLSTLLKDETQWSFVGQ